MCVAIASLDPDHAHVYHTYTIAYSHTSICDCQLTVYANYQRCLILFAMYICTPDSLARTNVVDKGSRNRFKRIRSATNMHNNFRSISVRDQLQILSLSLQFCNVNVV